jgi:uncharacterized protein YndB with AHSA1/START domain
MDKTTTVHSTFVIERHYPVTPGKVFAAFADPAKKRRWFAESEGFALDGFEMDFRVGGNERSRFRFGGNGPLPEGTPMGNDTSYHDIVPNRRIVLAYTMIVGDKRISTSLATFELLPSGNGTDLIFTEQGAFFEGADGPDIRKDGWQQLLDRLANELVR